MLKVKIIESPQLLIRKESILNVSPLLSTLSNARVSSSLNPLEIIISTCKTGNIQQMKEIIENCEKDGNDEDYINGVEENA